MVEITCCSCNKRFERRATEVKRSQKIGRRLFCSLACSGRESPPAKSPPKRHDHLKPNNRLDEYSPFRTHFTRLNQRRHEVTVTLKDLKELWTTQNGICPFTGWQMELAPTSKWNGKRANPKTASLDRIDSSKGYILDNVRWVSCMANLARNSWTDEDVIDFGLAIASKFTETA